MKQHQRIETEVLVIGGGASGIAAAYTAAKAGLKVMLIEKNGFLGGMATSAYVGTVCGLYYRSVADEFKFVADGFTRLFAEKLARASNSQPIRGQQGLKFLPYDRIGFMQLADEYLAEQNVAVRFHTQVTQVAVDESSIHSVGAMSQGENFIVQAKYYIDTTGYSIFGHQLDQLKLIESKSYQAGAMVFGLADLDVANEFQLNLHLIKSIKEALLNGKLIDDKSRMSVVPGSFKNGKAYFKLSIPFALQGAISGRSHAEQYARKRILELVDYLKNNNAAFSNSLIVSIAPSVGVRTGPRYMGNYKLTRNDVVSCKKTINSAAKGAWPIEFWPPGEKVQMTYFEEDDHYDIPMDCLRTRHVNNLYFAGRHISADEEAIASARVMGTCMQMGESIGLALSKENK